MLPTAVKPGCPLAQHLPRPALVSVMCVIKNGFQGRLVNISHDRGIEVAAGLCRVGKVYDVEHWSVLLLCGGNKHRQASEIKRAIEYLKDFKERTRNRRGTNERQDQRFA